MPTFVNRVRKEINGFEISVYEIDLANKQEEAKLRENIKAKVAAIRAHNPEYYKQFLDNPQLTQSFKDAFLQRIQEMNTPGTHNKQWFDVRRSRVTEFMSQVLLEKEYNCVFYEEADKRINVSPRDLDKHAPGIDVPGIILHNKYEFKFVVCEVKATKESKIPCSSAKELLSDIEKSYNDHGSRLSREILDYTEQLGKVGQEDPIIQNLLSFLIELVHDSGSKNKLLENVVFFPFLIRNNPEIIKHKNLNDFVNFKKSDLKGISLKGVIWAFNKDIDSFCSNLYDEVLASAQRNI